MWSTIWKIYYILPAPSSYHISSNMRKNLERFIWLASPWLWTCLRWPHIELAILALLLLLIGYFIVASSHLNLLERSDYFMEFSLCDCKLFDCIQYEWQRPSIVQDHRLRFEHPNHWYYAQTWRKFVKRIETCFCSASDSSSLMNSHGILEQILVGQYTYLPESLGITDLDTRNDLLIWDSLSSAVFKS